MSVSGISSSSVAAAYMPPVQQQQQAKAPQKAAFTDAVTLSAEAKQLASDADAAAQEIKESAAAKANEAQRGKA